LRILELTLASRDLAAQSAFWGERLGMPVREGADGACEVPLRASTIRFEQASPGLDPRYHFAINVPRGSIATAADGSKTGMSCLPSTATPTRKRVRRSCISTAARQHSIFSTAAETWSS
jgi:hypothetical protein